MVVAPTSVCGFPGRRAWAEGVGVAAHPDKEQRAVVCHPEERD